MPAPRESAPLVCLAADVLLEALSQGRVFVYVLAQVHLALTSPGLKESVSKSDMETLNYMFGDESGGVGC